MRAQLLQADYSESMMLMLATDKVMPLGTKVIQISERIKHVLNKNKTQFPIDITQITSTNSKLNVASAISDLAIADECLCRNEGVYE